MGVGIQYLDDGERSSTFTMRTEEWDLYDREGRYYALASDVELELDVDWETREWTVDAVYVLGCFDEDVDLKIIRKLSPQELSHSIRGLPASTRSYIGRCVESAFAEKCAASGQYPVDPNDEHRTGAWNAL